MRLVVGLGNPGPRYLRSRHNAGFWFVDALADRAGGTFRPAGRFLGEVCEVGTGPQQVRLLKPTTYMNRSGQAVAALARYYRYAPEEILVAHDEIDLPPGVVRLKHGGGLAGHKGLQDIAAHLGDRSFIRVRIGVGRPIHSENGVDYVLQRPTAEEAKLIARAIDDVLVLIPHIMEGDLERAMNVLHQRSRPEDSD
ncbi:MAG: aminoacyl-tRNA hydrolase [Gammaproteobacteria bacterium]|nr:aminoacyl-tRNA hydrolase [Gammaproteobacteria bacterium]NIR84630.1 aminoacyl-tRNA hydrolase [Gammaproteobacteria bacterium]NIR90533.1 aminoacyl-tRNA hydrolase [Gammaproteobacteria bacterium]NIU05681.1 aminoacyl-tRNA hydrolase [Gammaproteobacteria bacterium]NIV52820.1 aminoacyl-tRNA hydrolase [Gammaproteobacteria bacterium]